MFSKIPLQDHERNAKMANRRVFVFSVITFFLFLVLMGRMYYLQVITYGYNTTLSENNRVHVLPIPPARGLIYDRNGVVIADNKPSFDLTLTKERAGKLDEVLHNVIKTLDLPEEDLEDFEHVVHQVHRPYQPITLISDLSEEQIAKLAVNQFMLPGTDVEAHFIRHYPYGDDFAHVVGYVGRINDAEQKKLDETNYSGTDIIGKTGIEHFYEDELHGQVGYEEVETNARGRILRTLSRTNPIPGKDITLSLDINLQKAAEHALGDRRGAIVALDPNTGEVLAMVSKPSFDPNLFVKGISFKDYAQLRDSIDRPLYNRVLRGLYAPGSTIKPEVAIAGLDTGVITPATRIFDPGYYELPNYDHKYRNWNRNGDGWVDLDAAIMRSNDTYFYEVAHRLGIDNLHDYLSHFGLGQRVSIDMDSEATGLMPSREWKRATRRQMWYPGETLILGIGQGYMQVTPLQLAQATSLIASKGVWHRPHLAKLIGDSPIQDPNPMPNIKLHDPREWDAVNEGMQMVMHAPRGIARQAAQGAQYRIAGKSGTAQVVAIRQGERYDRTKVKERNRDNALFVGFAPAEDPKIVVAVMIENGEAGGRVAGPVVREVMDAWLLNVDGHLKEQYAHSPKNSSDVHG